MLVCVQSGPLCVGMIGVLQDCSSYSSHDMRDTRISEGSCRLPIFDVRKVEQIS